MPMPRTSARGAGIEGKWGSLIEERDELRDKVQTLTEERDGLRQQNAELMTEEAVKLSQVRSALEDVARGDLVPEGAIPPQGLVLIHEALREAQDNAQRIQENFTLSLSEDEQEAMDGVNSAFNIIANRWKLRANANELTAAVHVVQGFIVQHMLARLTEGQWGNWWEQRKGVGDEVRKAAE